MSYSRLLGRIWEENILFSALLELTYRCNLNCFCCYNDTSCQGNPLGPAEYQSLFVDLRELGTMNLAFSGGEPLEYPHFFELGRQAKELGFVVRVKSNGYALDEAVARRLVDEVEPFVVELSLHGATPEAHDRQTRVPGSFDLLMAHVQAMTRLGLRLQFNSLLTAWNEHQIEAMFDLADRLGVRIQFDTRVTPRDDGDRTPLRIAPSTAAVQQLFAMQRRRSEDAKRREPSSPESKERLDEPPSPCKHCGAGTSGVAIDPFGNVYPCVQWRRRAGNIRERSIREIWEESPVLAEIRDLSQEIHYQVKQAGVGFDQAGFCPALAEQASGDAMKIDEDTLRRRNILVSLEGSAD